MWYAYCHPKTDDSCSVIIEIDSTKVGIEKVTLVAAPYRVLFMGDALYLLAKGGNDVILTI